MQLIDHINAEAASLRAKGAALVAEAQAEQQKLEAQAAALEAKTSGIPQELAALTEGGAENAWAWIKSLF